MTVKELQEMLKAYPPNLKIMVAKDPEGNGFNPLSTIATDKFNLETKEQTTGEGAWMVILWP